MTTQRPGRTWKDGWTAEAPIQIGYTWAPKDGDDWVAGEDGFEHRDLGLASASQGALGVHRLRVGGAVPRADWQAHDVDFDFLYVITGAATLQTADGGEHLLEPGTTTVRMPAAPHRLIGVSDDFEAVRITAPAEFTTQTWTDAPEGAAENELVISHETPENYARGDGPREYFLYRDLGTKGPTDDRIHIHIVRATEPGEETGWHFHTMAQWFLIIGGSSIIGVEDRAPQPLTVGDAMCVGFGPTMRHNVTDFSADYAVLEMCVPATYETIAVDAPAGAAA